MVEARELAERQDAEAIGGADGRASRCAFARRVGENDALYGSVTAADIAEALAALQFDVDKRKVHLPEPLKQLGEFTVPVKLHRDVTGAGQGQGRQAGGRGVGAGIRDRGSGIGRRRAPIPGPEGVPTWPTRPCRTHAAAQPRGRAIGARRDPAPQRGVQPRGGADRLAGLLPRCAPAHLREDGGPQRARRGDRSRHAQGRAGAIGLARRGRRAGLHRLAGGRRAARGQRRALRPDRQGEVDPPEPDLLGQQDPLHGVRGGGGRDRHPRPRRAGHLRDRRGAIREGFVSMHDARARQRSRRSSRRTRGSSSSPACPPGSPTSTS